MTTMGLTKRIRNLAVVVGALAVAGAGWIGCGEGEPSGPVATPGAPVQGGKADDGNAAAPTVGPGSKATDARTPELNGDPTLVRKAQISMGTALQQVESTNGPAIEAKYEIGDDGNLSLSIYPVGKGLSTDPENNVFQELSGDPTAAAFSPGLETFGDDDREHLTRSTRDLTLVQMSRVSLRQAVAKAARSGAVYWAIPTIRDGRPGYGTYALRSDGSSTYRFIDGHPRTDSTLDEGCLDDLGDGPGADASDTRTPELGDDLTILRSAKVKMSDALAKAEAEHGTTIEAKFEIGDDGKLSLSIYPVGKGIETDAERNTFFELAGDPTQDEFKPELTEFQAPDREHLVRSARDLTIVQCAQLSLRDAVGIVEGALPDGMVYWAIPTLRNGRAGYGVYFYDAAGTSHYTFVN
jgi:hypothetical protein